MHHKLVTTGSDPVPVEINSGILIKLLNMTTTQEEADTIIVQQWHMCRFREYSWWMMTLIFLSFCSTCGVKVIYPALS